MKHLLFILLFLLPLAACKELVNASINVNEQLEELADSMTVEAGISARGSQMIEGERAMVDHVIDGDTIDVWLDDEIYRVRYIGVDTPERGDPFYREATDFNRQLVANQTVILVKDISDTDRYGRLLRYIYLSDGTFVNGELIAQGFARVVTFPPDVAEIDYLQGLQTQARDAQLGLWAYNELNPDAPSGCETCDYNAYNCRDFDSQQSAQACYAFCMAEVDEDIHRLDGGGDGLVCESLP